MIVSPRYVDVDGSVLAFCSGCDHAGDARVERSGNVCELSCLRCGASATWHKVEPAELVQALSAPDMQEARMQPDSRPGDHLVRAAVLFSALDGGFSQEMRRRRHLAALELHG